MGLDQHYSKERAQAEHDAEYILETIMHRQRWDVGTRDNLADAVQSIRAGHKLRKPSKAHRNGGKGRGSARA